MGPGKQCQSCWLQARYEDLAVTGSLGSTMTLKYLSQETEASRKLKEAFRHRDVGRMQIQELGPQMQRLWKHAGQGLGSVVQRFWMNAGAGARVYMVPMRCMCTGMKAQFFWMKAWALLFLNRPSRRKDWNEDLSHRVGPVAYLRDKEKRTRESQ